MYLCYPPYCPRDYPPYCPRDYPTYCPRERRKRPKPDKHKLKVQEKRRMQEPEKRRTHDHERRRTQEQEKRRPHEHERRRTQDRRRPHEHEEHERHRTEEHEERERHRVEDMERARSPWLDRVRMSVKKSSVRSLAASQSSEEGSNSSQNGPRILDMLKQDNWSTALKIAAAVIMLLLLYYILRRGSLHFCVCMADVWCGFKDFVDLIIGTIKSKILDIISIISDNGECFSPYLQEILSLTWKYVF